MPVIDHGTARSARTRAVVYVTLLLLIGLLFLIRKTLFVFALASMFAYLLYPFVDAVDRRLSRRARIAAVSLPYLLILGALVSFGLVVRNPVRKEVAHLMEQTASSGFKERLAAWAPLGFPAGQEIEAHESQILGMIPNLGKGVHIAARDLANFIIVPILSFLLLMDGWRIRDAVLEMFGIRPEAAERILTDAHTLMQQYMRALLILCFSVLICFSIGLSLMKVRYSLLLALLACPLEFVPVVGPLAADITIVGVSAFNGYGHIPGLIAFLISYRIFKDYVLAPHLMRKSVKLHPLLVIFGVFAGGDISGIAGIFLSVPVLALARLVYYEWRKGRRAPQRAAVSA